MSKKHPRSTFEPDPAGGDIVSVRRVAPRSLIYFCELCGTLHHHTDTGHSDGRSSVRFGSKCPKHPESYRLFIEDTRPDRLTYSEKSILTRVLSRASSALDRAQEIDAFALMQQIETINSKIDQACPPASVRLNACCLGCTERDGLALRCPRNLKITTGQLTAKRGCPDFKHDDAQQAQTEQLMSITRQLYLSGGQLPYQSRRMVQLGLTFPALWHLINDSRPDLVPAVEAGQKLKTIAKEAGLPMQLRKLPAGAGVTLIRNPDIFQWPDLLSNRLPAGADDIHDWALICTVQMVPTGLEWLIYRAAEILAVRGRTDGRAFASDVNDWLVHHPDIHLSRTDTLASVSRRMEEWHTALAVQRAGGDYLLPVAPIRTLELETTNHKFVQMDTRLAVVEEGRRMRHCIASYADNARMRQCLIFSMRKQTDDSSVLTLTTNGQYPYELTQARGNSNAAATPFQTRCANTLIDELNKAAERANPRSQQP